MVIYILAADPVDATAFAAGLGINLRSQRPRVRLIRSPDDLRGVTFCNGDVIYESDRFRASPRAIPLAIEVQTLLALSNVDVIWRDRSEVDPIPDLRDRDAIEKWLAS